MLMFPFYQSSGWYFVFINNFFSGFMFMTVFIYNSIYEILTITFFKSSKTESRITIMTKKSLSAPYGSSVFNYIFTVTLFAVHYFIIYKQL